MSRIEAPTIIGYTPDRLGDAIELMNELDVTAVVMAGMADSVYDETVKLHLEQNEGIIRHEYGSELSDRLVNIGWDLGYLASQKSLITDLPIVMETQTTIDVVEVGVGVGWHTDIVPVGDFEQVIPGSGYSVAVPYGCGVSVNLVDFSVFCVATDIINPKVTTGAELTLGNMNDALQRRTGEPKDYFKALLKPGDVIIWQQPAAHCVYLLEKEYPEERRRAFAFVNQDIVKIN